MSELSELSGKELIQDHVVPHLEGEDTEVNTIIMELMDRVGEGIPQTIWVGAVYDGGNDDLFFYAAPTEKKLLERLAAYAMEWAKVELDEEEYERFLHLITVEDYSSAIQVYFEEHSLEEWALYDEVRIGLQEWEETNLEDAEDLLEEMGARRE